MAYVWRLGDVFTNGAHRWAVDSIQSEKAILRSLGSSWAATIPLTFDEWREGGRWRLERDDDDIREPLHDRIGAYGEHEREGYDDGEVL